MFHSVGTFLTEKALNEEFYIYECGYEDVKPRDPYEYEPIDYYLIHFIIKGKGHFFINDKHITLEENQGFVIPPNTKNNYFPDTENPWSYRWIGFKGSSCRELFQNCGLLLPSEEGSIKNYIYEFRDSYQLNNQFKRVFDYSAEHSPYAALGEAYQVIHLLSSQYHQEMIHNMNETEQYAQHAITLIQQNYSDPDFTIEKLANTVQIERTYLFRLFKKYHTISPKAYLIHYRIAKSSELLRKTSYSIEEIAFLVGFNHASHFSRQFSKSMGSSPSGYRAQFYV